MRQRRASVEWAADAYLARLDALVLRRCREIADK